METYAYCLLPNHFHLLVRVRETVKIDSILARDGINKIIPEQFRKFFISYSQAINKQQQRTGSLFQKNFKRIRIDNHKYLVNLIYYIHANPQLHGLIDDFRNWSFSSYSKILIAKQTHLHKKEVLNWFGSNEEYKTYHRAVTELKNIKHLIID